MFGIWYKILLLANKTIFLTLLAREEEEGADVIESAKRKPRTNQPISWEAVESALDVIKSVFSGMRKTFYFNWNKVTVLDKSVVMYIRVVVSDSSEMWHHFSQLESSSSGSSYASSGYCSDFLEKC